MTHRYFSLSGHELCVAGPELAAALHEQCPGDIHGLGADSIVSAGSHHLKPRCPAPPETALVQAHRAVAKARAKRTDRWLLTFSAKRCLAVRIWDS